MPIFEFVCTCCGYRFEKIEISGNAPHAACPACGSVDVKKQVSPFDTGTSSGYPTASSGGG